METHKKRFAPAAMAFACVGTLSMIGVFSGHARAQVAPPIVWAPTSVPFATVCTSTSICTEVGRWTLGHLGAEVRLIAQPQVDDPIAQWGDCLDSVFVCLRIGGTVASCTQASICPTYCKTTFTTRLGAATDEPTARQVFEDLFLADGGECVPDPAAQPSPVVPTEVTP